MAPMPPRLKVLSVGGNAVSAFLSWRLQATNACDVTLVWKSGYEHVAQYGISFRSPIFGNERFKPRRVVRNPEDAANPRDGPFDYVVLCVKALPDVYDLASVIDAVVTPQHTCILINTTHTLGVESAIEERFPTNVVLSLVSNAELTQLGQSEFEHKSSTEIFVGPANRNSDIPRAIQDDMASALAMTLNTGQVECKVSNNIRQQQYERVIGVIFDTPNHAALLEKVAVKDLVSDIIDELLNLAEANGCKLGADFKQKTIEEMTKPNTPESIMWQDYVARRPMEVETYLGSPIKLAKESRVAVPRIETLYAVLHNLNIVNRNRPKAPDAATLHPPSSPTISSPLPRMPSQNGPRPPVLNGRPPPNGNGMPPRQPRPRNSSNLSQNPGMRRGPPIAMGGGPPNGYRGPPPHMNGGGGGGSRAPSRRGSMDGNDLEEFSHLVLYDDIPEGHEPNGVDYGDHNMREREMQLRQRELALREQEMRMRRGPPPGPPGPRRGPHPMRNSQQVFDDDDDDDDYFDPTSGPTPPQIDPDNFDMMSVTSRKNRKAAGPSAAQFRRHPEDGPPPSRGGRFRPFSRQRTSQGPGPGPMSSENLYEDPLMSSTSNRYGTVDRGAMNAGSRANSLTASRLEDMQYGPGRPGFGGPAQGMNGAYPHRTSHSPGAPYGGRPSPPNGFGPPMNRRPSPLEGGMH